MSRKKNFIHLIQISFFILITLSCYKEELVYDELEKLNNSNLYLSINNKEVAFDFERDIALFPISDYAPKLNALFTFQNISELKINGLEIKNGEDIILENLNKDQELNISFSLGNTKRFNGLLIFTLLPIVQVNTSNEIIDEPKVSAIFKITDTTISKTLHSYCGIELRGGSAMSREKKSFGIELWKDEHGVDKRKENLLGLRNDDDWILDAMYIDKARMRNLTSFNIWKEMVAFQSVKGDYTKSYIDGEFVEVFINNSYQGLYCFNERIDAKQLDIVKSKEEINGLLYKAEEWSDATVFRDAPDTTGCFELWAGWEQKHPKPEHFSVWKDLYEVIDFVAYSSSEEFNKNIYNYLDKNSLVDYFIFINLVKSWDNMGKNIILGKNKSDSPFFICPWDLDAGWGRDWQAEYDTLNIVLSMNIYEKLFEYRSKEFNENLEDRWFDLRNQVLIHENIMSSFNRHRDLLNKTGVIKRENERWPGTIESIDNEVDFISDFTQKRLQYLDNYFSNI